MHVLGVLNLPERTVVKREIRGCEGSCRMFVACVKRLPGSHPGPGGKNIVVSFLFFLKSIMISFVFLMFSRRSLFIHQWSVLGPLLCKLFYHCPTKVMSSFDIGLYQSLEAFHNHWGESNWLVVIHTDG